MGTTYATKAQIARAIAVWKEKVGDVGAVHLGPDASIRIEAPVDRAPEPKHDPREPEAW
ncbi:hypothetical protein JI664_14765 [Rhodobacter sp. NTK016B]|uniref:hypothetical protein n=1 Tax=Rhodobacter sp. NTK016B TaxID=2759676 RepID=UPI001A8D620E|nr:hypothetical protein [Rhodobacter sp. NTK016B]MBN8293234.1 hypothetical protein [Rhodobacter sp. NTK016B]